MYIIYQLSSIDNIWSKFGLCSISIFGLCSIEGPNLVYVVLSSMYRLNRFKTMFIGMSVAIGIGTSGGNLLERSVRKCSKQMLEPRVCYR